MDEWILKEGYVNYKIWTYEWNVRIRGFLDEWNRAVDKRSLNIIMNRANGQLEYNGE